MRRGWLISLGALLAAATLSPVLAQELNGGVIRGENIRLRDEPAVDAVVLGYHQRGEAITITGPAENADGETKTLTVESLTAGRDWYVPVEMVESGEAGWIAELFVDPRGVSVADAAPAETPAADAEPDTGNGNGNGGNNQNRQNRQNQQNQNQNDERAAEPTPDTTQAAGDQNTNTDRQAKREQRANQTNDAAAGGDTASGNSVAVGTQDNPLPIGESGSTGDWKITVLGAEVVSNQTLADENMFNEPAEEGREFVLIDLRLSNEGAEAASIAADLSFAALGPDNVAQSSLNAACGVAPESLDVLTEIFPGGTVRGNLCLQLPVDTLNSTLLYVDQFLANDSRVWFRLNE